MVGEHTPLVPGRKQKWTNAGLVVGSKRAAAWRVLNAQFFGVAQRRERVFAIICPLDGPDPSEILFEQKGVRGNPQKGRDPEADIAGTIGGNSPGGGWRLGADEAAAGHVVAHTLRGEGFDASEDGTGRGTPLVVALRPIAGTLGHNGKAAGSATSQDAHAGLLVPVIPILEPGRRSGRSTDESSFGIGIGVDGDPMYTLNAQRPHGVAYGISSDALDRSGEGIAGTPGERSGLGITEEISPTLKAKRPNAVAFGGNNSSGPIDVATTLNAHGGPTGRMDYESETFVIAALDAGAGGADDNDARGNRLIAHAFDARQSNVIQYGDKTGPLDTDGYSVGVLFETLNAYKNIGINSLTFGDKNADAFETDAGKILRNVRCEIGATAYAEWGLGVLASFQSAEILLANVLRNNLDEGTVGGIAEFCPNDVSEQGRAWAMREMRNAGRARRSPHQSRPTGQQTVKLDAYLSQLPSEGTQAKEFLRDLWRASEGIGILCQALSTLQEAWRSDGGKNTTKENVQDLRRSRTGEEFVREALHAGQETTLASAACGVRRLLPIEVERLQGFPDRFTDVFFRGKPASDGPRYAAVGNSMAVPVVQWIGRRIEEALKRRQSLDIPRVAAE